MILGMTDRFTGYVKLEPVHSTATAPEIADIVYRSWYRQFGLPDAITSDRDKLFTSKFWKELFKKIKVQLRMSTSFHPETDGSSERSNKTLIESLRHYVNIRQTDWVEHLVHVEDVEPLGGQVIDDLVDRFRSTGRRQVRVWSSSTSTSSTSPMAAGIRLRSL